MKQAIFLHGETLPDTVFAGVERLAKLQRTG